MSDRPPILSGRLIAGLVVLTLGVLWTLDNLGVMDASQVVRWWPTLALAWGLMCVTGIGTRRHPMAGAIWLLVGGISLLNTLGFSSASVFDLWPLFLIAIGASLVFRAWRGSGWTGGSDEGGPRLTSFAFMAGAERKVVAQDFRSGDVTAVMGGATVDLRPAKLAENRAVVDVFAMWGGIELIVPVGWRVVGEVTAILGAFVDSTAPPTDPAAPTLVVRGLATMGGVEVKNDLRSRHYTVEVDAETGEERRVRVKSGTVVVGARRIGRESEAGPRGFYGVKINLGRHGSETGREPRKTGAREAPTTPPPANEE